jgi:hypothetical protein
MCEGQSLSLWVEDGVLQSQPIAINDMIHVRDDGALINDGGPATNSAVIIQPIVPHDGVVAVAYVARTTTQRPVAVNGAVVAQGLYPLRHADRLDIARRRLWISAEFAPLRTQYAPASHGADVRCCLTKSKLRAGQDIVICPGVPGTRCGVVYKAQAWDAVIQQNPQMKCPNCGYRPQESAWQPPPTKPRKEVLDGLLQLAARR